MELNEKKKQLELFNEEFINGIKALADDVTPLIEELKDLNKHVEKLDENWSEETNRQLPLSELILRTTKTARKHKFNVDSDEGTYGTNHNGLGICYSSEDGHLNPLTKGLESYWRGEEELRTALFNEKISLELVSVVKKSNQKILLKTLQILKKYQLKEEFKEKTKNNNLTFNVDIGNNYSLEINFSSRYYITIFLNKDTEKGQREVGYFSFDNDEVLKDIIVKEEEEEIFKTFSKKTLDLNIIKVRLLQLINEHKSKIELKANEIKEELQQAYETHIKEFKELNEILKPLLVLDKI